MADKDLVRKIVAAKGWSKLRLAQELEVSEKTIESWMYENSASRTMSNPARQRIEQIAKKLKIIEGKPQIIYTVAWKPVATVALVGFLAWAAVTLQVIAITSRTAWTRDGDTIRAVSPGFSMQPLDYSPVDGEIVLSLGQTARAGSGLWFRSQRECRAIEIIPVEGAAILQVCRWEFPNGTLSRTVLDGKTVSRASTITAQIEEGKHLRFGYGKESLTTSFPDGEVVGTFGAWMQRGSVNLTIKIEETDVGTDHQTPGHSGPTTRWADRGSWFRRHWPRAGRPSRRTHQLHRTNTRIAATRSRRPIG